MLIDDCPVIMVDQHSNLSPFMALHHYALNPIFQGARARARVKIFFSFRLRGLIKTVLKKSLFIFVNNLPLILNLLFYLV